jgi:hypothetical protein
MQDSLQWIGEFANVCERLQSSQKQENRHLLPVFCLSSTKNSNSYECVVEGGDEVVGVFYHSKLQKNHMLTKSMDAFLALMRWLSALAGHGVLVYVETGHEWLAG